MPVGLLTLIPTPLQEELPLEPAALAVLTEAAADPSYLILVEELKVGRQRWLRWGLPRETIERFIAFNEHTRLVQEKIIMPLLKQGARAVIMSDGGLPAFCDPGQDLVNRCHDAGVKVTCTNFPNSVVQALAVSGFAHQQFMFVGFLPQKEPERSRALEQVWKTPHTQILMDTPYRRERLLEEIEKSMNASGKPRRVFLALELNGPNEKLFRGTPSQLIQLTQGLEKQEFVLVIDQKV